MWICDNFQLGEGMESKGLCLCIEIVAHVEVVLEGTCWERCMCVEM